MPVAKLFAIYLPLLGWTGLGWLVGRWLPDRVPHLIGKFLFWIGVPIGIVAFLRHAHVTWDLWLAPAIAWVAILLGVALARLYLGDRAHGLSPQTRTSFTLTSMVGNTGYIGFPVSLMLVGPQHFAWAVFYDMLGSTPGAYGLGVALATQTNASPDSIASRFNWRSLVKTLLINPALWSFAIGLLGRDVGLPNWLEAGLHAIAWGVISLALILVGMRLSRLSSFKNLKPAALSLSIKMVLVPLIGGIMLRLFGVTGELHRVLLLQMAMPPAFASLVISEAYELDREMAVTTIAIGSLTLLVTLPLWLWLFP